MNTVYLIITYIGLASIKLRIPAEVDTRYCTDERIDALGKMLAQKLGGQYSHFEE